METTSHNDTLLVTGGTGYIGSHTVVEVLETEGHCGFRKIVIVDNLYNSSEKVIDRFDTITGYKAKGEIEIVFEKVDIKDEAGLDLVFTTHGPIKAVIHFAGLKAVGESVTKPIQYYENNVGGTVSLLKVMAKHACNNIVFSSSATVYGDNPKAQETDPTTGAINPYGQTKAMIEQILADVAHTNKSFSAIVLRYFNPIGAHKSGEIGEDPLDIPNNLMPYIQRIAAGKLPFLSVYGTDYPTIDGTGVRDYIHVTDLAKGHTVALDKQLRHQDAFRGWHAINLGTGNGTSVLELVAAFERASGLTIEKKLVGRRAGDVATLLAVPTKANEVLGWKAELTIDDMCRDSWAWVKKYPNGFND